MLGASYAVTAGAAAQRDDPPELVIAFRGTSIFADWWVLTGQIHRWCHPKVAWHHVSRLV